MSGWWGPAVTPARQSRRGDWVCPACCRSVHVGDPLVRARGADGAAAFVHAYCVPAPSEAVVTVRA